MDPCINAGAPTGPRAHDIVRASCAFQCHNSYDIYIYIYIIEMTKLLVIYIYMYYN